MKTYLITFEITSDTHPEKWNWDNFLNLSEEEDYQVMSITEKGESK